MSEQKPVPEIDRPLEGGLGTLTFYHGDNVIPDCACDRLVVSDTTLMAASFVTTPIQLKAVRAVLHANKGRVEIRASDLTVQFPSKSNDTYYSRQAAPRMDRDEAGYHVWVHKLEYGKIHATVISKDEKLILYVSPEAVWDRLMDSEVYETPLLREWMPYVAGELVRQRLLRECKCFRANSAILDLKTTKQLDDIVINGLKDGKINIP